MITTTLYTRKVIAKSEKLVCPRTVNLRQAEYGIFTMQLILTGDGELTVTYLLSHDGIHFLTPATSSEIVANFVVTDGPEGDGVDLIPFDLELAPQLRLQFEETSGANPVIVTAIIATH